MTRVSTGSRSLAGRREAPSPAGPAHLAPWLTAATLAIAALAANTSLLGLFASWPYASETDNWRLQAQGQDVGNLVAVATLLAGLVGSRRGSSRSVQLWLGSLLYLAYAFVIYAVAVHFGPLFLPYVATLGLSAYALLFGAPGSSGSARVAPRARTLGALVLAVIASGFALLWLASIVAALASGEPPAELTDAGLVANPVHVLDLALVLPGMVIAAVRARTQRPGGDRWLAPWLVFAALMAASIVAAMLLASAPLAPVVVLGVITLVSGVTAVIVLSSTPEPARL
ncbi:MAG TPA: hypothetical protein PKN27_06575 [Propionibacteriaceae bacterium]|nr:hypothetical protein [Propionibacteriaceae bacterium]